MMKSIISILKSTKKLFTNNDLSLHSIHRNIVIQSTSKTMIHEKKWKKHEVKWKAKTDHLRSTIISTLELLEFISRLKLSKIEI